MKNLIALPSTICVVLLFASPALAKSHYHHRHHGYHHHHRYHHYVRHYHERYGDDGPHIAGDPRPGAWCGYFLRHLLGVTDRAFNLAREWAHYGHATQPHIGAVVVWPHHVGKIVGGEAILSGNDGHRVRTRVRSVSGAIAFRE